MKTRGQSGFGIAIAASVTIGAFAGIILGQPSIGFLAGLGAGVVFAILLSLWKR